MRIASWRCCGRLQVGTISADRREATPLALADATRGAMPLIEADEIDGIGAIKNRFE